MIGSVLGRRTFLSAIVTQESILSDPTVLILQLANSNKSIVILVCFTVQLIDVGFPFDRFNSPVTFPLREPSYLGEVVHRGRTGR
jgi:hypothetical protein